MQLRNHTPKSESPNIVSATWGNRNKTSYRNNTQFAKPLPPYGKEAAFLLSMGVKPRNDIFLFAGEQAWLKAKAFENLQVVICLPLDTNPFSYSWPVYDCSILMFDTGKLTIFDIEKIAYCLLCANAEIVRAIPQDGHLIIYRRN